MSQSVSKTRSIPPVAFLASGGIFLFAAIVAAVHSVALGVPSLLNWTVGEAATACAGFGTVAAISFALYQFSRERLIERSKFALDMAMAGVERSYAVLTAVEPPTNIAWVAGARVLLRAQTLATNITEVEHHAAWRLFEEEWRIKFHHLTTKPAEYYFGLPSPSATHEKLDYQDAHLKTMMLASGYEPSITMTNRQGSASFDRMLNPRPLKVIFDFAQFPENYRETDGLQTIGKFSRSDRDRMDIGNLWGLFAYLYARDKWTIGFRKLHDRPGSSSSVFDDDDDEDGDN